MQDGLGGFFPASNYIDLGLFEHVGEVAATQKAPVKFGAQVYGMSDFRVFGWLLGLVYSYLVVYSGWLVGLPHGHHDPYEIV